MTLSFHRYTHDQQQQQHTRSNRNKKKKKNWNDTYVKSEEKEKKNWNTIWFVCETAFTLGSVWSGRPGHATLCHAMPYAFDLISAEN